MRGGTFALHLPAEERALVRQLLDELRGLLTADADDPRLRRLYPTAYPDDPAKEAEFRRMVHEELRASRTAAIAVVESTLDADALDGEQLDQWMQAINAVRLVLGTTLDVSEDDDPWGPDVDDDDAHAHALYGYLGFLLEEIVTAYQD